MPGLRLADWEARTRQANNKRLELQQLVEQLSPQAREFFVEHYLPKLQDNPTNIKTLYEQDYFERPVKVEQFIDDPYFLGQTLRHGIFPKVKDTLIELFDGNYFEVSLSGSIGWGKSTCAYIGIAYDIYLVSCLKSPAESFGLIPGSNVAFLNVSVNKRLAQKIMFGGLFNLIKNSPYFRENFPWDKNVETELRFPRNIFAYPVAASPQAILGEGVFSAAFDEINFYQIVEKSKRSVEGGEFDQAFALYNLMSRRIRSRMNKRGRLPGHLWLVSSARYPSDFTEKKAAEALNDPTIFVREYADWETKPARSFMQKPDGSGILTFSVEVGDLSKRTRILVGGESDVNEERVIQVPEDYREVFTKDPDGAVRDHAGISVLTVRPFITQRHLIAAMFEYSDKLGMKHPFTNISVTLQDPQDHLIPENLHYTEQTEFDYETNKEKKVVKLAQGAYFAHIDLALTTDAAGVSVGHVVGSKKVWRGVGQDRREETKPIIRIDLALQIVAPKYGEIQISSVRGLLYKLRELGMEFGMVSYDSWNSADSIQTLKSQGFTADVLSMDRDTEAYEELKDAIYDGRLLCYSHPVLNRELSTIMLDEKKKKIDHPPQGCFRGDARIALLDGTCPTFKEVRERFGSSKTFGVYSMSLGGIVGARAVNPRVTKTVHELVEILLDNYQVILCTPDHPFMLLNGQFKVAETLTLEDSLMPLYRSSSQKGRWADYERVWCPVRGHRLLTHQMVAGKPPEGYLVHHKNENRRNNDQENLEWKLVVEHARMHTTKRHHEDIFYVARLREGHRLYRESGGNEKSRQNMLSLFDRGILKRGRNKCAVAECEQLSNAKGLCDLHYQRVRRATLKAQRASTVTNHRILAKKLVREEVEVWDLSVPEYENYALACGVFVHNSKDISDAVAGVVHHAEYAFANGMTGDWQNALSISKHDTTKPNITDREMLLEKVANGEPLTSDEIARL